MAFRREGVRLTARDRLSLTTSRGRRGTLAALVCSGLLLGAIPASSYAVGPGSLLGWGFNNQGQLGDGTTFSRDLPVDVALPPGVTLTSVAGASFAHSLGVTSDGRLLAWGNNNQGQLGDGTTTDRHTPVFVDLSILAPGENVIAAAGGEDHSFALTSTGRVLAWGNNLWGNLGDGTTVTHHTPVQVSLPLGVTATAITAGYNEGYALTSDGRILAWGLNNVGQLGDGTHTNSPTPGFVDLSMLAPGETITAIASKTYHTLALTSQGRVIAWGDNPWGQLGDGTTTNRDTPVFASIPSGVQIASIGVGWDQSLAVTTNGDGLAWGTDDLGQLGNGPPTPVVDTNIETITLPPGVKLKSVDGGIDHSVALTTDGRVLAFGYGGSGQMGNGTNFGVNDTPVFVTLAPHTTVSAVAAGEYHNLAVADLNTEPTVTIATPLAGGTYEGGSTVFADYACSDTEGLASCVGTVADGASIATATLGAHSFSVTATDTSGLQTTKTVSYTVSDTTNPSVTITSPVDGAVVEYGSAPVAADYSCSDLYLATCVGTVADGQAIDASSLGSKSFAVTGTDSSGNQTTKTVHYTVVDTTLPAVTITTPVDGATYSLGQVVNANYGCTDLLLASCTGTVPDGQPIDTASVGTKAFTVTGVDTSGNARTRTVHYIVRAGTRLVATPSVLQLGPGLKLTLTFSARLTRTYDGAPVAGRTITFGSTVFGCSAVTNANGVATCGGLISSVGSLLTLGYEASFGGDADNFGSSARAGIIQVGGLRIL